MKRLLLTLILFTILAAPIVADSIWLAAFEAEHGYTPQDDPGLLARGMTPDEALAEHLVALQWSRALGHTPDAAEWTARWCKTHSCWRLMSTSWLEEYLQQFRIPEVTATVMSK